MDETTGPAEPYQKLALFSVPPGFRGRSGVTVLIWSLVQGTLIRLSPQPAYGWRAFWWRRFGAKLGSGVKIRPTARVTYPWKVTLGDDCWIGDRAELYSLETITVGDNVCISQDSYICTGSHSMMALDFGYDCKPITIESEVWVAAGAFVGPGVVIRRGAVLAARGLTFKDLCAGMLYAGQPARAIRPRRSATALEKVPAI